jgi:hypothetical protein
LITGNGGHNAPFTQCMATENRAMPVKPVARR